MDCTYQNNNNDCGLYAIANTVAGALSQFYGIPTLVLSFHSGKKTYICSVRVEVF